MKLVHKICTLLRINEGARLPCYECPACEDLAPGTRGTRGCRVAAQEFVNIFKTGNPWGIKGRKWPSDVKREGTSE